MQKKLIALAIAGLSSAAFAQSNVTVYGVIDMTQESVKATGATAATTALSDTNVLSRGRLSSNSSLIGFKGSEALGNGLTAIFQYESGIAADTAGALAGGRDTFVGLTGGFGTLVGGTLTHPYRALGAKVDNNPGASSIGFTGSIYGEIDGVKTGTDDRATNAIAYVSPSFSGLTATVAYVNGERKQNTAQNTTGNAVCYNPTTGAVTQAAACGANVQLAAAAGVAAGQAVNSRAYQFAAQYDNGPLFVGFAHHDAKDPAANLGLSSKFKGDRLAAAYTFGGATRLSALWDKQKLGTTAAGASELDTKRTAWMIGASHTMGANQIYLQFAKAKNTTGSAAVAGDDTSAKQATLGYAYSLSKRTTAHAYYTKITNAAQGSYDFYVNGLGGSTGVANGADPVGYGVGLRHTF